MMRLDVGYGLPLAGLLLALVLADMPAPAEATENEEVPLDIVADSVRSRGYTCDDPKSAERDEAASKPDEAAWLIDCGNARYRVIYQGDAGVDVEEVD
jgi:hypothetical protein